MEPLSVSRMIVDIVPGAGLFQGHFQPVASKKP
jgi:hypothetical protein